MDPEKPAELAPIDGNEAAAPTEAAAAQAAAPDSGAPTAEQPPAAADAAPAPSDSQQQPAAADPTAAPSAPPQALAPAPAPAPAAVPSLYPEGVVVDEKQVPLYNKVKSIFKVFDKSNSGSCDIREAGTILRALGVYPTEAKLKELIMAIMDSTQPTIMTFEQFIKVTWPLISTRSFAADSDDLLYRAFLTIDKDNRGYIDVDQLKNLMQTLGEPMTAEEMEEMVTSIGIKEGHFFYEDYLALLG
ncbi:hypothetical protein H9P43_002503 [Blastocladiella emersonii ATCC 22665]|nr:hypothetical protein H9P43_002503 [Blastocladiella emersonii ATCC 22665]